MGENMSKIAAGETENGNNVGTKGAKETDFEELLNELKWCDQRVEKERKKCRFLKDFFNTCRL